MLEVTHISFDDYDFPANLYEPTIYGNPIFPIEYSDIKNNYKVANYVSFDALGIDLEDNTKKFLNGEFTGFISSDVSDENCNTTSIALRFEIGDTFPEGITLCFYGQCCKKLWIQYSYDASGLYSDILEVTNSTVYIPISPYGYRDGQRVKASSVLIAIDKTDLPYQSLKLQSIIIGKVNVLNKFKSSNLLEEINILSDDLPINSFECEVISENDFSEDEPLNVYSNNVYYGTFFISESELISKDTYSLKAYSPVQIAENTEFSQWVNDDGGTLSDFTSWLSNIINIEIHSYIDLSKYSLFGHLPIVSSREAICAAAFACGFMVDTSRDYKLNFIKIPTVISSKIDNKRIIGNSIYKKSKIITGANWQYPLFYDIEEKTIKTESKKGVRRKYLFENPSCLLDNILYELPIELHDSSYNFIDFTPLQENVELNVAELKFTKNEVFIQNPDSTQNTKSNIVSYDKFLLTGYNVAQKDGDVDTIIDKSSDISKYIRSRGTIQAKIRLQNEKVGDLIQIETAYSGTKTGIITSMNIHFGYENIADIEVLEWQNG